MALTGCPKCLKYLLVVFNILFGVFGCAILGIGILSFVLLGKSLDDLNTYTAINWSVFAIIFVAAGILIILSMCICGCCGALKEHKLLLALYFIFLFILVAFFLGIGIYMIIQSENLRGIFDDFLKQTVNKACDGDQNSIDAMKSLQESFKCCGAEGATDYVKCPTSPAAVSCSATDIGHGCTDALYDTLGKFVSIPAYVFLGIAGFILPGMIISLILFCALRRGNCD